MLFLALDYLLFLKGMLVPFKAQLEVFFLLITAITILRYVKTVNYQNSFEAVAEKVFSPAYMKSLRNTEERVLLRESAQFDDAIIIVATPRNLESLLRASSTYLEARDAFRNIVFSEIDEHRGGKGSAPFDAVMGFWDVPLRLNESSPRLAFECAIEVLGDALEFANFLQERHVRVQRAQVAIDACLDSGPVHCGYSGDEDSRSYVVQGPPVRRAYEITSAAHSGRSSSLVLTEAFYRRLPESLRAAYAFLKIEDKHYGTLYQLSEKRKEVSK